MLGAIPVFSHVRFPNSAVFEFEMCKCVLTWNFDFKHSVKLNVVFLAFLTPWKNATKLHDSLSQSLTRFTMLMGEGDVAHDAERVADAAT